MDNERRKKLLETMKSLNKTMGEEYLTFAEENQEVEKLKTGIVPVDNLIGHGLRCGHVTVVYGASASGKSTLVYQTIANMQKEGKICALIDIEHSFEAPRGLQFGVNLEDLILIQKCTNAEQSMDIIIALCREKVVDFIALDSIHALSPKQEQETKAGKAKSMEDDNIALLARKLSEFFRKVGSHLFNAKIPLLLVGQCRISGIGTFMVRASLGAGEAIKFYMYTCLFMRRGQGSDAPTEPTKVYYLDPDGGLHHETRKEQIGFDSVIKLEKTKSSDSAKENTEIHLPFYYETGFNPIPEREVPMLIEGTDEEKHIIHQKLIQKGILKDNPFVPILHPDKIEIDEEKNFIKLEEPTVEEHLKEKSPEFQEKVQKAIETKEVTENIPKKRGRPSTKK